MTGPDQDNHPQTSRSAALFYAAFLLLFLAAIGTRAYLAQSRYGHYIRDDGYFLWGALGQDLQIVIAVIALHLLLRTVRPPWGTLILRGLLVLLVGGYILDLLCFYEFNHRLYSSDFRKFVTTEGSLSLLPLMIKKPFIWGYVSALLILGFGFLTIAKPKRFVSHRSVLLLGLVLISILPFQGESRYANEWIVQNFLRTNLASGVGVPYSEAFKTGIEQDMAVRKISHGRRADTNIILLIVEGLSNWQSTYFSGIDALTPELDRIARKHMSFKNFHANGFNTEGGLVALLAGEAPIPIPSEYSGRTRYKGYHGTETSLPALLEEVGYRTEFLTPGDLGYSGKKEWLDSLGFSSLDGHENPVYEGIKRFHFKAVSDEIFYRQIIDRLLNETSTQPFFWVLETVSSHQPFIDPMNGLPTTINRVISYSDFHLGRFYDDLQRIGFFHNGLLIIVGDHRSMTPLLPEEFDRYGESASAMVPMVLVDGQKQHGEAVEEPFQQIDLYSSFLARYKGERVDPLFYGDFLAAERSSPRYILHARGDDRSLVNVFSADGDGIVRLDGDDTAFVEGELQDAERIIRKINSGRVWRER